MSVNPINNMLTLEYKIRQTILTLFFHSGIHQKKNKIQNKLEIKDKVMEILTGFQIKYKTLYTRNRF